MKRPLVKRWTAGGAVAALCVAMTQASLAEVRSSTLGIDINCPSGLSE
jgi:hypothetical protein